MSSPTTSKLKRTHLIINLNTNIMLFTPALLLLLSLITSVIAAGMQCKDHPLYKKGMRGEIIRSWEYAPEKRKGQAWYRSAYQPRFSGYYLAPENEPTSTKYMGLDFFATATGVTSVANFLTLHYQRPAKTYLFVSAYKKTSGIPQLEGWESEGWARKPQNKPSAKLEFGVGKTKSSFGMSSAGFVFSKTGTSVQVPSKTYIKANVRHLQTKGFYTVLVAEQSGKPTRQPTSPKGMRVTAGALCPQQLHDKWTVSGADSEDRKTRNKQFRTWHPLWDPCWWCSYGHEHGSAAPLLMGYWPRYGYTAFKHRGDTEAETHAGFKDFVLDTTTHRVYYGIHMHVSSKTRFATRHHTVVVAAQNKQTGELEYETRVKADFGALTVRKKSGGVVGVTTQMESLRRKLDSPIRQRLINVLDPSNPKAGGFDQRAAPKTRRGHYEQWSTVPLCSVTKRAREPTVDVKDPATALRTASVRVDNNVVVLGRENSDGSVQQGLGLNREFRSEKFVITDSACEFKLRNILARPRSDGRFYTDAYGVKLVEGAGEHHVSQFVKMNFSLEISGDFMTTDTWLGLYRTGYNGAMKNVMNGVLPGEN